ncbi:MAG TPA: FecR family protein [Candidatus Acidoferrum sp.]|nr:FecR family protein [Candidatus Acidoferrum sp.]
MKTKSPYAGALACAVSALLCLPGEVWAAPPDTPAQRAGEVSRVIPAVNIARGAKTINAAAKTQVDWLDVVNTQASARARIALDDGSVLNVGSESSIKVVKHDGGAQQTELELTYGKLRSQAQKITKADGKFQVKTPAGVAGVVGTDFFVSYDATTGTMNVTVFEGLVKVCNLAGVCVEVKPGQLTNVRTNDSTGPQPPTQATLDVMVSAGSGTEIANGPGVQNVGHHLGKGAAITLGVLAAIPAIVIPVVATHGGPSTTPPVKGGGGCSTNPNGPNC